MPRGALAVLLGAASTAAAVWGHVNPSAPLFYAGVIGLVAALGPVAFAAGRGRWPARALRTCTACALVLVAGLGIELLWALAEAVKQTLPEPPVRAVYTYAGARADPDAFLRWWRSTAASFRTSSLIVDDPRGVNPYVLAPHSVVPRWKSTVRINSLGFRGPEISVDKGEAFRIIALGESTTFGYTLYEQDESWPRVLEGLIRELGCAAPVEVVNGGVPGWTVTNHLRRFVFDILPLEPDLVISYHGYNGFSLFFKELPSMQVQEPPEGIPRASRLLTAIEGFVVRRRFLARYEAARELSRLVPELDLADSLYARRYRQLAMGLATRDIPLALATFNMAVNDESPEDVIAFYEQVFPDLRARMLANRMHAKLVLEVPLGERVIPIDTREQLDGEYETLFVDAVHFTQTGRERLAANLLAGLREHLIRHPRMRCPS